ncbi:Ig-like domain-containing protein [Lacimicrobium alkaliphilum]|uniref:Big-1 domain-containing protein n=1 Tax=Lacimicrobium alkaliphilum TaxID=1526571 RepID=A0A0U2JIU2_9ALTE|nr:Ig-like domain-containing protein [Lacimicrobium alkaliphilum]ALS98310.1 hypothetical protein AT746_08640 [Lacimicrobium alkaliphilum]
MRSTLRAILAGLVSLAMVACGGGGSVSRDDSGGGSGSDQNGVVTIEFEVLDSSGNSVDTNEQQLSASEPWTINATVKEDSATSSGQLVTFTLPVAGYATLSPSSGTATTNNDGVASIEVRAGDTAGGFSVVATAADSEEFTLNLTSAGDGNQSTVDVAKLSVFASTTQLPSSGSDEVEIIVLAQDEANALMENVEVSFAASSGQLSQASITTGADGTARNILTTLNEPENREILITARAGGITRELTVNVVGTEIRLNAPSSVILNDSTNITINVADSDGQGIPNQPVTLTSANGNTLSDETPVTDATGQVSVTFQAENSGVDVITATALNTSGSVNISVQQDEFSFTQTPQSDVELGDDASLTITWLREGQPFVGGDISLNTTRGTLSVTQGVTNANGQFSVTISSANAGPASIYAKGEDGAGNIVNSRADMEFVATEVDNIIVDASPKSIGPDGQKSTITAVLRDPQGNLVKGKTINFTLDDVTGGSIDPAVAVTDSKGLASTVYTSNTVTTGQDAVVVTATEQQSSIAESTSITVGNRAQFISLGTGNTIQEPDETSYLKVFTVFVTDVDSNPVSGADLTITGTPVKYTELLDPNAEPGDDNYGVRRAAFNKGYWSPYPSEEDFEYWVPVFTQGCANEDVDSDGLLDPNEDTNGDGELSPGNIISIDGNVTTDENGQALIELRYPQTYGAWVMVKISVSTGVTGSESTTSQFYRLGVSNADLVIENSRPNTNPFGDGRNFVEDPDNPGTMIDDGSARTCTNTL